MCYLTRAQAFFSMEQKMENLFDNKRRRLVHILEENSYSFMPYQKSQEYQAALSYLLLCVNINVYFGV